MLLKNKLLHFLLRKSSHSIVPERSHCRDDNEDVSTCAYEYLYKYAHIACNQEYSCMYKIGAKVNQLPWPDHKHQDMPVGFSPKSFLLYTQSTMTVVWHQPPAIW